jgi:transglutaminase-like putative cysteine protease
VAEVLILLINLLVTAQPNPAPGPANSLPAAALERHHAFYGIYLMGRKCGWAEEWLGPAEGGQAGQAPLESRTTASIAFQRAGIRLEMRFDTRRTYSPAPPNQLETLEEKLDGLGTRAHFKGERDAQGRFVLQADTGAGMQPVPLKEQPRETWLDAAERFVHARGAAGQRFSGSWFDTQTADNVDTESSVVARTRTLLHGGWAEVVEVRGSSAETGLAFTSRLLPDGTLLEGTMAGQFRMAREEEATAKDPDAQLLDLYEKAIVKAGGVALGSPGKLKAVTYRICGVERGLLEGPNQAVTPDGPDCVKVLIGRAAGEPEALDDKERAEWLASDNRVSVEDPAIRKAARAAAGGERPDPDPVRLMRWVHDHVRYTLDFNPFNALEVLRERKGDCSEYALLFVALARALGLPAREVSGLVLAQSSPTGFGYHAWAEVYAGGRWLPVDPTWDEAPVNPTHIRFNLDGPYRILSIFGRISIDVLEAK